MVTHGLVGGGTITNTEKVKRLNQMETDSFALGRTIKFMVLDSSSKKETSQ